MPDKLAPACGISYPLFRYPTIGMPDKLNGRRTLLPYTFRYPTIGMPDKLNFPTFFADSKFRYPTIGMPDKLPSGPGRITTQFRYPTIGMPDKLSAFAFSPIIPFRYPTIGMPDKLSTAFTIEVTSFRSIFQFRYEPEAVSIRVIQLFRLTGLKKEKFMGFMPKNNSSVTSVAPCGQQLRTRHSVRAYQARCLGLSKPANNSLLARCIS